MIRKILFLALTIGVATSFQRRFGLPAHFSFRTVHNPSLAVPTPAPHTFFFRPSRVTPPPSFFNPAPSAAPKTSSLHVPVMVPVPKDFKGDSVVVTPEQLNAMKISTAVVDSSTINKAIEQHVIDSETAAEPTVEVVPEQISQQNEVSPPISAGDDAFVLTGTEQAEIAPVANIEPSTPVQQVVNTIPEVQAPIQSTASAFQTETHSAYQQFLNTWLRLASVNLNRPELLGLMKPTGQQQTSQSVQNANSMFEGTISHSPIVEELQPVSEIISEPPQTIVEESPVVLEAEPVLNPEVTFPMSDDKTSKAFSSKAIPANELVNEQPSEVEIKDSLVDSFVDVTTIMPEMDIVTLPAEAVEIPTIEEQFSETNRDSIAAENISESPVETLPEAAVENLEVKSPNEASATEQESQNTVEASPVVETASVNEIAPNSVLKTQPLIPDSPQTPVLLNPIPRVTSRGRFSGFRYSFSHIPQRGTYFFNSISS